MLTVLSWRSGEDVASGVGSGGGVPYESSSYSRGCTAEETTAGEGAWSVQSFSNSV